MIPDQILNRKGARKREDVPAEVLEYLNHGKIETVNLTEWLAIDHAILMKSTFLKIGVSQKNITLLVEELRQLKKPSAMNSTKLVGTTLYQLHEGQKKLDTILKKLTNHSSDAIRCYAPYLIALDDRITIEEKLNQARSLIADHHFGVREVVWMALRPEIDQFLERSIQVLSEWTKDENENIRRFTTEATRPRGVWCKHIESLKEEPELALPILENLKSDPARYVQDSVGNWLNDASKSQPDFVINLCKKWQKESPTKATAKIIKKAKRTIEKK